jgi:glutathione S-transferase
MIIVHHLNESRSQRILWLLEELGLDYEVKRYERDRKTMLAPELLRAVHPLGKSPIITDGDIILAESGAIVEYLIGVYGDGRLIPPQGSAERRHYAFWLHHAEGSAMPLLVMKFIFQEMTRRAPFFIRPLMRLIEREIGARYINPNLLAHVQYWETTLAESTWFAGPDFTGADIMMSFPAETAAAREVITGKHPKLMAFLNNIHARPAYRRALERGGPYAYAEAGS